MVRPVFQTGGFRDSAYLFWSCPDLLGHFWTTAWCSGDPANSYTVTAVNHGLQWAVVVVSIEEFDPQSGKLRRTAISCNERQ